MAREQRRVFGIHETGPPQRDPAGYHERPRNELIDIGQAHGLGGRVLDLGCAGGVLGGELLRRGLATEVIGVERDPQVAGLAASRLTKVICADVSDPVLSDRLPGDFDTLIFADVLEHLPDPLPVLKRFVARLPPHGICLVSLPNVRYFRVVADLIVRNQWTYRSEGVCDATHLRFFTSRSAIGMLEEAGLDVVAGLLPLHRRAALAARFVPGSRTFLSAQLVLVGKSTGVRDQIGVVGAHGRVSS